MIRNLPNNLLLNIKGYKTSKLFQMIKKINKKIKNNKTLLRYKVIMNLR